MSETDLQRSIKEALEGMGVWVIRTAVRKKRSKLGVNTGEDGMPDLWTEYGWIEVKLPGETLDPDQVIWHRKAEKRGVNAGVAMSVGQAIDHVKYWQKQCLTRWTNRRG